MELKKTNKRRIVGLTLVVLSLILISGMWKLVILGVDTTPPNFVSTTPFDKAQGDVPVDFLTNRKYSAKVTDATSGVSSVIYTDDVVTYTVTGGPEVYLSKVAGSADLWEASFPVDVQYEVLKDYSFTFYAYDAAGNLKTLSGTFRVYSALQGKWYINDVQVTSPTQTIWVKTNTVTFKFVKTAGVDDTKITCTAQWGTTTRTLTKSAAATWTDTVTLNDGVYTITLKANDGTTTITLTLYNLQIGSETMPDWLTLDFISGVLLGSVGLVLIFRKPKP